MLEALEAPLADSRAAAVNIRLMSCIGRQAKIGFCLQTRNSFNLLCCLLHQTTRSPSYRLLADRLSQHGCCQVLDDHLAGRDRHNYGHKMMLCGLPASLPGRLTESTVWSDDRIWPGVDS